MAKVKFERRHFEYIAHVVHEAANDMGCYSAKGLIEKFADELQETNDKFDRKRFIEAATPLHAQHV